MGTYSDAYDNWLANWNTLAAIYTQVDNYLTDDANVGYVTSWAGANQRLSILHNAIASLNTALLKMGPWQTYDGYLKTLLNRAAYILDYEPWENGEEYELTWGKIVEAWTQADITGRLWTILAIDFMRKEIWDEPVTTFAMKKGHP